LITLEEFTAPAMPSGWSTTTDTGYAVNFPGGAAVFSRSPGAGNGFARLTYGTALGADFFALAVVPTGYTLVDGSSMALVTYVGGGFVDIYLRNSGGSIQAAAYNSLTSDNPWTPWGGDAILVLFRAGDNIQAGIMASIPLVGGVPDFSGFSPLASWSGSQYLGNVAFELSFGQSVGPAGAEAAGVDVFALATTPYAPDFIPPGGPEIPEPATAGLAAAGLLILLLVRRRRIT
jgi:MYXO-CTERM domain-containing protein